MAIFLYRNWPEIRKSEIPLSEFCLVSGDWGKLGIPNLTRMSIMKCYWMLQNAGVTAFTLSELLREKQQWKISQSRLGLNVCPDFFSQVRKRYDNKTELILKFMMSSTGKKIIAITILTKSQEVKYISQWNLLT